MMCYNLADTICKGNCAKFDLVMIAPFKEDNEWYFQLRYHIVKKDGEEGEVVIPKVRSPFRDFPMTKRYVSEYLRNPEKLMLDDNEVTIECSQYEGHNCLYYYVKIKDAPVKEMTHEEIEKELGYPFKEVKKKKGEK